MKLLGGFVTQCLMGPHLLIDPVPGEKGGLLPAQVSGQLLYLVEFLLIGAERTLYSAISLRIVGAVKVAEQCQFLNRHLESTQKLTTPIRLDG